MCAQVFASWTGGAYHGSAKAYPLDTTKYFNWNEAGQASVFLRIVPG